MIDAIKTKIAGNNINEVLFLLFSKCSYKHPEISYLLNGL